jgi:hypothetical protein
MTKQEYVRTIRDVAARHLEVIRDLSAHEEDGAGRIRHWEAVKEKLSAHTAIELCDF